MIARASAAWVGLTALLCLGAVAAGAVDPTTIDWQPARAFSEPWRAFSAVAVHYSGLHLAANLSGGAVVAALGVAARVPWRCVWAWLAAWPLTQFGLLLQPQLTHYGGLSGVLHAAVAVVAVQLVIDARGARRAIGAALLLGLIAKVLTESPWGEPLRHPPGWDIAVAPLAHATGLVAGAACALVAALVAALLTPLLPARPRLDHPPPRP